MSQITVIFQRLGIANSVADQNEVRDTLHEIFIALSPIDLRSHRNRQAVREAIRSQMPKIPTLIQSSVTTLDGVVDILYELFARLKFRWSRQLAQQQESGHQQGQAQPQVQPQEQPQPQPRRSQRKRLQRRRSGRRFQPQPQSTTGDKRDKPTTEKGPSERPPQRRRIEKEASSTAGGPNRSNQVLSESQQKATSSSLSQGETQNQARPRVRQGVPLTARRRPGILTGWSPITTRSRASRHSQHASSQSASTTSGTRQTAMPPTVNADKPPPTASQPTSQEARQNTDEAQSYPRVDNKLYEPTGDTWVPEERFRPPKIRESFKRKRFTQEISQLTESMELTSEVTPPSPKRPRPSLVAELTTRRIARLERERIQSFSERQRRGSEIKSPSSSGSRKNTSSGSKSSASDDKPAADERPRFRTEIDWMSRGLERMSTSQRTTSICLSPRTRPRPSYCY